MAIIRKKKIGKKCYYYLEHTYKAGKKVKIISKYLGTKEPKNIEQLKKEIELEAIRKVSNKSLIKIKNEFAKELKKLPKTAIQKKIESFMVDFVYNSDKIEGSKLSLKDTAGLFLHGETPANKPLKDVKEAEGHKDAFYDIINCQGGLNIDKVCQWHKMIFNASNADIAGKIRLHKIIVTESRTSFPHPEELDKLLKEFFKWYDQNKKRFNPVEFTALVHLKFVTIHPFTDGNGRISRLLANYVLFKNKCPLFNIKFQERRSYYHNLEKSQIWNNDNHFLRFFIKKYIRDNKDYL